MKNIINIIKINTVLFLKNRIILFLSSISNLNIENNTLYFLFTIPIIKTINKTIDKIGINTLIMSIIISLKFNMLLPSPKHKFHTICNKIEYFSEYLYAI